jgi:glycosyltransferase involved in cell wall biosynthesis
LGHAGGDRLADTYANGDIFFFPSRTEVFPNNLIEAMASGLPVITDDVGVNRAIVKDGVTGVLVKVRHGAFPNPGTRFTAPGGRVQPLVQ